MMRNCFRTRLPRRLAVFSTGSGALLALTLLVGCDRPRLDEIAAVGLANPDLRHEITFAHEPRRLSIELAYGRRGLDDAGASEVYRFLGRYKAEGGSGLIVLAPAGTRDREAVRLALVHVAGIASELGIERQHLAVRHVAAERRAWPTLEFTYARPVAVPPTCGEWPRNVEEQNERVPYANFGCATQRNLALTVDNARDLVAPRGEAPRAAERRSVGWTKYTDPKGTKGSEAGDKKVSTKSKGGAGSGEE
jgi:pilus assembly protein CpaD